MCSMGGGKPRAWTVLGRILFLRELHVTRTSYRTLAQACFLFTIEGTVSRLAGVFGMILVPHGCVMGLPWRPPAVRCSITAPTRDGFCVVQQEARLEARSAREMGTSFPPEGQACEQAPLHHEPRGPWKDGISLGTTPRATTSPSVRSRQSSRGGGFQDARVVDGITRDRLDVLEKCARVMAISRHKSVVSGSALCERHEVQKPLASITRHGRPPREGPPVRMGVAVTRSYCIHSSPAIETRENFKSRGA